MKKLQELLKQKRREARLLAHDIQSLIERLRPICDHSETEPYVWEHDSGYGVQTDVTGKQCSYCGAVDFWSRGRFIDRGTLTE
jgi:hypothetical protein